MDLTIPGRNSINLNLFDNYGHQRKIEIKAHATTYVNTDTRQTQNNNQLYHFLKISLTASLTTNIITESTKYHICNNPCGALLLKLILWKLIIDTGATVSNMRENLSSMVT